MKEMKEANPTEVNEAENVKCVTQGEEMRLWKDC
jgi:hypothetical protein